MQYLSGYDKDNEMVVKAAVERLKGVHADLPTYAHQLKIHSLEDELYLNRTAGFELEIPVYMDLWPHEQIERGDLHKLAASHSAAWEANALQAELLYEFENQKGPTSRASRRALKKEKEKACRLSTLECEAGDEYQQCLQHQSVRTILLWIAWTISLQKTRRR